jgi:hypothetical protein
LKKQINLNLINSIINSDFFLLRGLNGNKKTNHLDKQAFLKSSQRISSLNILELVKTIKQFIRLLQFLKNQNDFCLTLNVENKQNFLILKDFLIDYKLTNNIKIYNTFSSRENAKNDDSVEMFLLLGNFFNLTDKRILTRLNSNGIFLISNVNTKITNNNLFCYRIYNDLFDFKKLIFLIVLISQILKK